MLQVRLGDDRRSRPVWGMVAMLARMALVLSARPLWRLPSSRAGDPARRASARPPLASASQRRNDLEQWFARYQLPLLEYLYGMTRDREWAADLAQETFLRALAAITDDPAAIEHPQAWLYRIATNVALSALRRRRRFSWLPLSVVEPEVVSGQNQLGRREIPEMRAQDVAVTVVERDAVWSALDELPPRWRAALLLQTVGGFETSEIAAELSVSEVNARKILFRAKERFRQITVRRAEAEAKGGR